jgi:hypothetical protein
VTGYVVGAALLTLAVGYLLAAFGRWVRSQWFLMRIIYWFLGLGHHGKHLNGRLTRPELVALRCGTMTVFLLIMLGLLADARATITALSVFALVLLAAVVALAARVAWMWRHYRKWLRPLHLAAHQLAEIPRGRSPAPWSASPWLQIERDRSRVVAALPAGWPADEKDKQRLVSIIVAKTGIENPDPRWHLAGPKPMLELTSAEPPPPRVTLATVASTGRTVLEEIQRAGADVVVWGLGKALAVVDTSMSGDSPHGGLSMASGAGKSVQARGYAAQMLYKGCLVIILDYKMISHQWAKGLPNVVIYRRPHEIHDALVWLDAEAQRRNEVALAGADLDGNVHAVVGDRIIVICEELNATMSKLRAYWRQERNEDKSLPQRSPALEALDAVNLMGRQVLINLLYMGQRLSVKAIGGDGDARESIGVVAFGRYSVSNWKMLAPDFPMPPQSRTPGRIQVVTDKVRECQGVFMTAAEARDLALAGCVAQPPAGMPGARAVPGGTHPAISGADQQVVLDAEPVVPALPELVTLSQAVREGIVSCSLEALRKASQPKRKAEAVVAFPESRGHRGIAALYVAEDLAMWDAEMR